MDRTDKYKTLLNNTFLISIGTFGSKLLSFFMVRFYTGVLTPTDYGTADLIVQTANLLFPLISMGITESVFRFALNDPIGRKNVFSVGTAAISAGALVLTAVSPFLSGIPSFGETMWLVALYTIASCYHSLCAQFIRAQGKTALFAGQGVLNTALVIGMNILFLAVFQWGITGYICSIVFADLLCSLYLVWKEKLWRYITFHPERQAFRLMLKYSVPLIPTTVFWWITSVSDRYMITAFLGSDANGLYAVACKIPTLISLVSGIFLEAWHFSAISEAGKERGEQARFFSQIWSAFLAVMFLAGSVIIAFSQWEIRLLSDPSYHEAWRYIPMLSAAMIFSAFVTFMGSVYVVEKRSLLSFWTAMAGAGLNLLLNALLIPSDMADMGVQGAAIATMLSYLVVFLLRAKNARALIPFRLYKKRLLGSFAILCAQIWAAIDMPTGWQVMQGGALLLILAVNGKAFGSSALRTAGLLSGNLKRRKRE